LNAKKAADTTQLEELIAVKGGIELNQRVAALRAAQIEEKALQKEQHVRQLKQQVEENTYKAAIDRYLQLNYERGKMQEMVDTDVFRVRRWQNATKWKGSKRNRRTLTT
jgi:DNA topoisomerase IB